MNSPALQRPVALGRIDYMNVAPVYYGLDNGLVAHGISQQEIRLISGPPSTLNRMMIDGSLDISPVSSAAYVRNARKWLILPDLAIACHKQVLSVLLVSRYSLEALTGRRILITDESSSARDLCRLIFSLKGVSPEFVVGKVKDPALLPEDVDAALVIGDAALSQPWGRFFPNIYDMGTLWWHMTGLPFVFALWAVRKEFAGRYPEKVDAVLALLKTSRRLGNENMDQIVRNACVKLKIDASIARLYYRSLVYDLNDSEKKGLAIFCNGLHQAGITEDTTPLFFFKNGARNTAGQVPLSYAGSPALSLSLETADCCPAL